MPYFWTANGLRGCYMPDNSSVIKCDTRRELRAFVESESRDMIEAHGFGYSERDRAAIVARVWAEAKGRFPKARYDHVIGFGRTRSRSDRPFGLFLSHATRADYLAQAEGEF